MYPIHNKDWQKYSETILDHGLNAALLTIAGRLFPGGFDVRDDAPDSYEKIVALFESGKRYVVFGGGSESTIFGDPHVNHSFRAWHDWCHWQGQFDFSLRGEFGAYKMQCCHLSRVYGDDEQTTRWKQILFADIIGQKLYFQRTGEFPIDQMAFVRDFLTDRLCAQIGGRRPTPNAAKRDRAIK
jgi:hypothetical protein